MKRIIPILLALTLVFLLAACGGSSDDSIVGKIQDIYNSEKIDADDFAKLSFTYNFSKQYQNEAVKKEYLTNVTKSPFISDEVKKEYGDDVKYELTYLGSISYGEKDLVEWIKNKSDSYDTSKVTAVKTVGFDIKITGSKKTETKYSDEITIVEADGDWYVYGY